MALDLNILFANALLDRYATEFPAGSILELRTGAPPGAEAAASGTLLATMTLPATPWPMRQRERRNAPPPSARSMWP